MSARSLAFASALLLAGLATPASAEVTRLDVVKSAITGYVRPMTANFAESATALREQQASLCAGPSESGVEATRQIFAEVVKDYSRVEFLRYGPMLTDNRVDRLLFYPDPKGIALRQIQALIAAKDATAANPDTLKLKSVAVQGLGAMEYVLYGDGAESLTTGDGAFRCLFGAAISANVALIAQQVAADWADDSNPFVAAIAAPAPDHPAYRTDAESLQEIVGTFIHGFEAIRDLRLGPAVGAKTGTPTPNSLLWRRSGLTVTALQSNFTGLANLFDRSRLPELLSKDETAWMLIAANTGFSNAGAALAKFDKPLNEAVADEAGRERVTYLMLVTKTLQTLFADQMAPALGLSASFSALDGD